MTANMFAIDDRVVRHFATDVAGSVQTVLAARLATRWTFAYHVAWDDGTVSVHPESTLRRLANVVRTEVEQDVTTEEAVLRRWTDEITDPEALDAVAPAWVDAALSWVFSDSPSRALPEAPTF